MLLGFFYFQTKYLKGETTLPVNLQNKQEPKKVWHSAMPQLQEMPAGGKEQLFAMMRFATSDWNINKNINRSFFQAANDGQKDLPHIPAGTRNHNLSRGQALFPLQPPLLPLQHADH